MIQRVLLIIAVLTQTEAIKTKDYHTPGGWNKDGLLHMKDGHVEPHNGGGEYPMSYEGLPGLGASTN